MFMLLIALSAQSSHPTENDRDEAAWGPAAGWQVPTTIMSTRTLAPAACDVASGRGCVKTRSNVGSSGTTFSRGRDSDILF